ncbi:MAG: hypothetical protein ACE5GB_12140, partial [Acidimicrobiales bacterium]
MTSPPADRSPDSAPVLRYDLSRAELSALLACEPRYRVDQVWRGLYERGDDIDHLTDVPKPLRARLTPLLPPALE